MPATADLQAPLMQDTFIVRPVEAATKLFAGTIGAVNAAGNGVPAADTAGLKVVGRVEEQVDNTSAAPEWMGVSGSAGDKNVRLRREPFKVKNSESDPVVPADLMHFVYVEDDSTVSHGPGTNHIAAGLCIQIDDDGVWIDPEFAPLAV